MRQNIVVFGATGKVGGELLRQVAQYDVPELGIHENPTVVVGLGDSTHIAIQPGGLPKEVLDEFVAMKARVLDITGAQEYPEEGLKAVPDIMEKLGYGEDIVYVDATGVKEAARDLHLRIIQDTRAKIVTANKNPIGLYDYDIYRTLTRDPTRYQYSATAMAGLGAVPWLSERHTIQDRIHEICASLSGTVGFIADALKRGEKLSAAIRTARQEGYTEPDFRDDLNGVDVARKLTILGREAGLPIHFEDIALEPFLPREYLQMSDPEECLYRIERELNAVMAARYAEAQRRGITLKYLASLASDHGKPVLKVGLVEVPLDSAFGNLHGTDNRIEVVTDQYSPKRPYKLEGPGAGLDITASVLRRDLLHLQDHVKRF